jgi:hypothetical protein
MLSTNVHVLLTQMCHFSTKSSSQQRLLISQSQTVTSNQLAQEDTIDNKIKNQIKAAIPDITTSVIDALKAHGLIMPQVLDKQTAGRKMLHFVHVLLRLTYLHY